MRLIDDWRLVLRRAWSVKFNIAATAFGAAEVAVAIWKPDGMPNGMFAGAAAAVSIFANVSRLMAQKELHGTDK
ncbi:hypothetical protein LXA47_19710 [Massilia sp. P8910]|uniref:DUF7940 domain-containing protein n=1 Tax=Massilia antarctica TaxID=2765360 RepID=UPI001E4BB38F|nr:hypothetical protein [Massilia antarctica]MCE3605813.1 hypothetical protein [Massilia antarctica]